MRNPMLFAAVAAVTLLCGCGQKGPLVLPDAQSHKPKSFAPAAAPPVAEPASAVPRPSPEATPSPTPPTPAPTP